MPPRTPPPVPRAAPEVALSPEVTGAGSDGDRPYARRAAEGLADGCGDVHDHADRRTGAIYRSAAARGLEGYVLVRYDVDEMVRR